MNAAKQFSVYPTAGQVVNVMHRSGQDRMGNTKLEKAAREQRTISQVHIIEGGYPTVKDSAGDTWSVRPAKQGEWDTVIPE